MENDRVVWKKRIGYLYYQFKAIFASQESLAKQYDALAVSCPESNIICEQYGGGDPVRYERHILEELAEYSFEGDVFWGPKNYDAYLTASYGAYMELPPEDQRENRHQIVKLDFGE